MQCVLCRLIEKNGAAGAGAYVGERMGAKQGRGVFVVACRRGQREMRSDNCITSLLIIQSFATMPAIKDV